MGYTTEFLGAFKLDPPLTSNQVERINNLTITAEAKTNFPGTWCDWEVSDDGTRLYWNESEKFYYYMEWLDYIQSAYLKGWKTAVTGQLEYRGEEFSDYGIIKVVDGKFIKVSR